MDWLAPVFGLAGVIVGGILNSSLSAVFERRRELAEARVAAKLARKELKLMSNTIRAAVDLGRWAPYWIPDCPTIAVCGLCEINRISACGRRDRTFLQKR